MSAAGAAGRRAVVALGANLGEPVEALREAVVRLQALGELEAVSPVYRTKPIGYADQPDFLNAVAVLRTGLDPEPLLDALHAIEDDLGRVRTVRFGPRTLDLDLVWYEGVALAEGRPLLPHPRAHEREFVLRPLCDVAPEVELRGRPACDWLAELGAQGVEPAGVRLR